MVLSRLADKFVLRPSRHPLPTEGKSRRLVDFHTGPLEVWTQRTPAETGGSLPFDAEPELFILKLPGTGGRAERATPHPAEAWGDLRSEIWAFNPPGYGGSEGKATLKTLHAAVQAVFREFQAAAGDRPIIVTGNSLGTTGALALAAEHRIDGLILRNPPPLRELIVGEYGWWNLTLAARLVARQVPRELDSVRNAARARAPAVFISSGRDRLVPPHYQQRIITAYRGGRRVLHLAEADHACPLAEHETDEYAGHLSWLREQIEARRRQPA